MLSDLVRGLPSYTDLLERVRQGEDRAGNLVVSGGVGALPALLLAALARELSRSLAIVVASEKDAERWVGDLEAAGTAARLPCSGPDADAVPADPGLAEGAA